jgi:FKBP-type peptidyl-prolyl cis-trans isomerase
MTRNTLITGIAVAVALVVVAFFFIVVNPLLNIGSSSRTSMATPSSSGFVVQDESVGNGTAAGVGDVVTVDYTGKLENGTVFDSSSGRKPLQFVLGIGQVIPGWDQGLQGMKVGGKRLLIIPPALAYGSQAIGPIPANSTLIFEVTLLGVQPANSGTQVAPEGSSAN